MKLCPTRFGLAAATAVSVAFSICSVFVYFFRDPSLKMMGWMVHMSDLQSVMSIQITPVNFIGGLVQYFICTYLIFWFFAFVYNSFCSDCNSTTKCKK
ncbi:hypothetical protein A3F06_04040 [candidate division TM6 bacterium RIFCSPHIGHO2_12_FULL_36_22]|nr:MAG: hypothetical protein A3F06_04040 [candidate division TM6 bacterium RIFCSPHIGHO2_12_FULL_36_22]